MPLWKDNLKSGSGRESPRRSAWPAAATQGYPLAETQRTPRRKEHHALTLCVLGVPFDCAQGGGLTRYRVPCLPMTHVPRRQKSAQENKTQTGSNAENRGSGCFFSCLARRGALSVLLCGCRPRRIGCWECGRRRWSLLRLREKICWGFIRTQTNTPVSYAGPSNYC